MYQRVLSLILTSHVTNVYEYLQGTSSTGYQIREAISRYDSNKVIFHRTQSAKELGGKGRLVVLHHTVTLCNTLQHNCRTLAAHLSGKGRLIALQHTTTLCNNLQYNCRILAAHVREAKAYSSPYNTLLATNGTTLHYSQRSAT